MGDEAGGGGLRWPALIVVGLCTTSRLALAVVGPHWPLWVFMGLVLVGVGPPWPSLACVGRHGLALACVGPHWPSWVPVGLHGPALA
jgi:hypothetical protein